jgi:phage anti-repressor protein
MISTTVQSKKISITNKNITFKSNLSQIITNALSEKKDNPLTELEFAKLVGFTDAECDMLKVYWDPIFNGSWIYLSDELILEYLTKEKSKYAIKNFYKQVFLTNYEENIDYKEVTIENEVIKSWWLKKTTANSTYKPPSNKKYYIVTGECYKCMLMASRTPKGKDMRMYYIKVEGLARNMKDYFFEYMSNQKDEQISNKDEQIEHEKTEKYRYMKLHNSRLQKHRFFKFKKTGPCFYAIIEGLEGPEYAAMVVRIKIGICGCPKKKMAQCPHCEKELNDNKQSESFDGRLQNHRTLWPRLQVKFAVYTDDAELLERCIKRVYKKQINPGGHEIIENVEV